MTDQATQPEEPEITDAPQFDKTAARARYKAMMRSKPMLFMYGLIIVVLIATWVLAFGSAYAPNVEDLAGHSILVGPNDCKSCHNSGLNNAPTYNHSYAPTCGFCHRQGLPADLSQLSRRVQ